MTLAAATSSEHSTGDGRGVPLGDQEQASCGSDRSITRLKRRASSSRSGQRGAARLIGTRPKNNITGINPSGECRLQDEPSATGHRFELQKADTLASRHVMSAQKAF